MVDACVNLVRPRPSFGPVQRQRAALLAGSVLFHVAVLTPLALRLFEPPVVRNVLTFAPPVFLQMEPRPLLPGEATRKPAPSAAARDAAPTLGEVQAGRVVVPLSPGQSEAPPSPPAPRLTANAPAGPPPANVDAWTVTPEGMAAAVARSMRTGPGGCRIMDGRLNPGEQALCDERFNEAAGRAGPLGPRTLTPSEARREAQFARDGAQALAQYEARRRRLSGGIGIVGPGDCPGSNLGAGCAGAHLDPAIRQGATTVGNPGLGSNDPEPMRPIPGQE